MKEIDFQLLPLDGRYFLTVALKRSFSGNKKLYTSKEVKEFSKMLERSKTTGNQCWNAQETHRPHDLSIGKDHLLSQKQESSSAYSTCIFKVQVLNDQALFLC